MPLRATFPILSYLKPQNIITTSTMSLPLLVVTLPLLSRRHLLLLSQRAASASQRATASCPLLLPVASCSPAGCHVASCHAASILHHLSLHRHLTCPSLTPPFICAGWLLRCISLCCLRLSSSCQHRRLSTRRCLTSCRQIHLLFPSCMPLLAAMLPLVAPWPHIHQLALPLASASCQVSFLSAPASFCVVSHQPATLRLSLVITSPTHGWLLHLPPALLSLIAVAWPLIRLRRCLLICHSQASCPDGCCVASLLSGWLLHCLSSSRHLPSAGDSASHCTIASRHAPHNGIASRASSPAGFCIASPHAAASHLPVPLPIVAPLSLVTPLMGFLSGWLLCSLPSHHHLPSAGASASHCIITSHHGLPLVPLVRLVVALPLLNRDRRMLHWLALWPFPPLMLLLLPTSLLLLFWRMTLCRGLRCTSFMSKCHMSAALLGIQGDPSNGQDRGVQHQTLWFEITCHEM